MSNGDRKRRKWGCVVTCKDADESIVSWQTRYQSPVNPRQRIYRRFGVESQTEAYRWLDETFLADLQLILIAVYLKNTAKTQPSVNTP